MSTRPSLQSVADLIKFGFESLGRKDVSIEIKHDGHESGDEVCQDYIVVDKWVYVYPHDYTEVRKTIAGDKEIKIEGYAFDEAKMVFGDRDTPDDVDIIKVGEYPNIYAVAEAVVFFLVQVQLTAAFNARWEADNEEQSKKLIPRIE